MSCMPDKLPTSVADVAAPSTSKFIKIGLNVFERGENLLQNGISHRLGFSQKSRWKVRKYIDKKTDFSEKRLAA